MNSRQLSEQDDSMSKKQAIFEVLNPYKETTTTPVFKFPVEIMGRRSAKLSILFC